MSAVQNMPAIHTSEKQDLFRQMLRIDGIFTMISSTLTLLTAGASASLIGMTDTTPLILIMGLLLVYGISMFYYSRVSIIPRWYAWLSTEIDFAWAVGSLLVLITGTFGLNDTGKIIVFVAAVAVCAVVALKYVGLRRMSA